MTVFSGNEYVVVDLNGQQLFHGKESGGALNLLVGKNRAFDITITDMQDNKVITLRRPYTFGPDKMEVTVCNQLASVVRQEVTFMKPVLNINDPQDRLVLRVKGPAVRTGECDFEIFTPSKKRVGVIRKLWGGCAREVLTSKDNFRINFPTDLDVRYKAALIGTCFLIVITYNIS
ncbi:unnamed protein product [Diatraea saccharalis]|uniref:Phospholipid scramblase n=1 Tax=Diatraea saccharalis TaxID=40085 RepID=A0A9N9RID2_9NEOP|nr:unnamed protein product [Diatraea saccharalis]